jgi:hypothetical protein
MSTSSVWIRVLAAGLGLLLIVTAAPPPWPQSDVAYAMPPLQAPDPTGKSEPPAKGDAAALAGGDVAAAGGPIGFNFVIQNDASLTEREPAIAYNSQRNEYLVVWYNDRPGCDDVRAQRVSARGTLVGGPFYMAAGCPADRRYPDVTFNSQSGEYLVVWEEEDLSIMGGRSRIMAQRVAGTGGNTGARITVTDDFIYNWIRNARPAVAYAYTSNKFLVVWSQSFQPSITTDIVGQVLSAGGPPSGGQLPIYQDSGGQPGREPDLAYNVSRNEYLVVWQRRVGSDDDIYARRVTGDGVPLMPSAIVVDNISKQERYPAVAALAAADQYLVVWDYEYSGTDHDIHGRFVTGAGTAATTLMGIATSTLNETRPAVAGLNGPREYLVVWSRKSAPPFIFQSLYGRNVSSAGGLPGTGRYMGGLVADHGAVTAGRRDFLAAFDDTGLTSSIGIYGQLWGNRTYLPAIVRQ